MPFHSMSSFIVNGLQNLMDSTFLFWRLETVRMSFSVKWEKTLISDWKSLAEPGFIRALTAMLIMMNRQQNGLQVSLAA